MSSWLWASRGRCVLETQVDEWEANKGYPEDLNLTAAKAGVYGAIYPLEKFFHN